jgi:hypothetical protein
LKSSEHRRAGPSDILLERLMKVLRRVLKKSQSFSRPRQGCGVMRMTGFWRIDMNHPVG